MLSFLPFSGNIIRPACVCKTYSNRAVEYKGCCNSISISDMNIKRVERCVCLSSCKPGLPIMYIRPFLTPNKNKLCFTPKAGTFGPIHALRATGGVESTYQCISSLALSPQNVLGSSMDFLYASSYLLGLGGFCEGGGRSKNLIV